MIVWFKCYLAWFVLTAIAYWIFEAVLEHRERASVRPAHAKSFYRLPGQVLRVIAARRKPIRPYRTGTA